MPRISNCMLSRNNSSSARRCCCPKALMGRDVTATLQLHEIEHFGDFLVAFHSGHAGHPQTEGDIFDKRAIVLNKMADASEDHSAYSGGGRIFQRPGSSRTIFSNKKATLQLDNA